MSRQPLLLRIAHGLALVLLLAAPLLTPAMARMATMALFMAGGFHLRLADRRFTLRGASSWISHIRMAPRHVLPWAMAALAALAGGQGTRAGSILLAATMAELLLYPICAHAMARLSRSRIALVLILLIASCATLPFETALYALAFVTGVAACLFWLRGPDGEASALSATLAALALTGIALALAPALLPRLAPLCVVGVILALAHLSTLRRRPVPWRRPDGGDSLVFRRPPWRLAQRLS